MSKLVVILAVISGVMMMFGAMWYWVGKVVLEEDLFYTDRILVIGKVVFSIGVVLLVVVVCLAFLT